MIKIPEPFSREDLYVLLWANPEREFHRNARPYETFSTKTSTPVPYAFPFEEIKSSNTRKKYTFVTDVEDFYERLDNSTKNNPIALHLPTAESAFGWQDFEFCHFFGQF